MQLRHLRLEIFSTFSEGFWIFEAHFVIKNFLIKKCVVCNQHYRNIHDPRTLVNAFKFSILLLLGLPKTLETLLKNLRKGTQSSVKWQDWGQQPFKEMNSSMGVFEGVNQIRSSFLKSLRQPNRKFWAKMSFTSLFSW